MHLKLHNLRYSIIMLLYVILLVNPLWNTNNLEPDNFGNKALGLENGCREGLVQISKYNGNLACVKPTSVYPLLQRGWASHEKTNTTEISLQVARWFVEKGPTFTFDGMPDTLVLKMVAVRESYPEQYVIESDFSSRHGGYGDRTDKMVTQVITPHTMEIVVSSGNVISAIIDDQWDELNQQPWKVHSLPDVDTSVTQNSNVMLSGYHSVETTVVDYDGVTGFLAKPTEDGSYSGIVMIHEWWGLNDNMKEMAIELSSHGYIVLAVDLFDGRVATSATDAMELVSSFNQDDGISNMNKAADFLLSHHEVEKLGSIGWCFGGGQSLNLALNNENMDATVIYYGRLVTNQEQLSSITWPVLGIFAELDQGITVESVKQFESSLNELDIPNEIHIYTGVDHAFANPSGRNYAPQETEDAWKKTIEFLERHLK